MAVDLLALNENLQRPSALTIEQVQDLDTLKAWCHIANTCFEWSDVAESAFFTLMSESLDTQVPFYHYMGYLNGEPVATSSLLLGAGVAGIYNVATLPDARRQGIGTAITLAALRDARATGYRIGILQAYEMGLTFTIDLDFKSIAK
jgi:ribosomal protein S18 acetylase RimI-like enzyme